MIKTIALMGAAFIGGAISGFIVFGLLVSNDRYETNRDTCDELYDMGYRDGLSDGILGVNHDERRDQ